mgnify:CR=1 FL=1
MPKLTDEQIARAYGYAAALQDRGGVDGQVGTAFLEVMQAYVEQRDALAQADALAAENARLREALAALVSTRDDDGSEPWFVKAPQGGVRCICCGEDFAYVGKFHHAPDCPIAAARRALDGDK